MVKIIIILIIVLAILIGKMGSDSTSLGLKMREKYINKESNNKDIVDELFDVKIDYEDKKINEKVFDIFSKIEDAISNQDLSGVSSVLTDTMYNVYERLITKHKNLKQINVIEDLNYVRSNVVSLNQKYQGEVNVLLEVSCRNYYIDIDTKKIKKGNKKVISNYVYEVALLKQGRKYVVSGVNLVRQRSKVDISEK